MSHLDPVGLMSVAMEEATDRSAVAHVATCETCGRAVHELRSGLALLRVLGSSASDSRGECLDDQALAGLVDGSVEPERRDVLVAHLGQCAGCRAAASSVARARSSPEIRSEISALESIATPGWRRAVLPLAAAAVAVLLLVRVSAPDGAPIHRGPVAAVTVPQPIAPVGPTEAVRVLRWHGVPGADRYRVTVFGESGEVLFETSTSDTIAGFPADVTFEPDRLHYWIVAARVGFDRWETSRLVEFTTAGARP